MKLFFKKEGQGPPLIFMHGLFGMLDNWQSIGRQFQDQFTVYLVDQRNHGHSPHDKEFTFEVMSNDLLELMDAEGMKTANLLGHSMGGKTVMQFAIHHPQRVDRMIVADISPRKYSNHQQHLSLIDALLSVNLQQADSREQVRQDLAGKIIPDHVRQFLLKNLYWKQKGELAWRLNLEVIRDNLHEVFREIESPAPLGIPALFLKGEKSGYIKTADEHMIRRMFPNARIQTIQNGSHWLHADNPADFTRQVMTFLNTD